ncbi:MAG TPA: amino acid-binding protein [Anaeromyxobacteraceae bacterium]|nr:amino acid-binding protein [Anaeromyxobacteraceae bacterium]
MEVAQISIFLENRTGGLADVFDVLARSEVDVKALSLADMSDFGILRLVVPDPERTWRTLKDAGFTVDKTRVVAVEVPDRAGGLLETLLVLKRAGINVEYMYSVARRSAERAVLIFRFDEIGRALEALRAAGITVLDRLDP